MDKQLRAALVPTGFLLLEWDDTDNEIGPASRQLENDLYQRFSMADDSWLLLLGLCDRRVPLSDSLAYWRDFCGLFIRKLSQTPNLEYLRINAVPQLSAEESQTVIDNAPLMPGLEYLRLSFVHGLWQALQLAYVAALGDYSGSVASFLQQYRPDIHLIGRIFFHLVENPRGEVPFAFMATYSTELNEAGESRHVPLRYALTEYAGNQTKLLDLLVTVYSAAKKSALMQGLLDSGEIFHPLAWSAPQALLFLREIPFYEESGILCRIPHWWKTSVSALRLDIQLGDQQPSLVGLDAILNFNVRLLVGDTPISIEEARALLAASEGLAFIKNKWVAVDPEKLRQTLDAYEKAQQIMAKQGLTLREAIALQLHPGRLTGADNRADECTTISHGAWLAEVFEKLRQPLRLGPVNPGPGFKAQLRPYQQQGLNWLHYLHSLRFGACLADDMGLGKTIELLAFLSVVAAAKKKPAASLLIIPASLIANWLAEIGRFLPTLHYLVAHPDFQPQKVLPAKTKKEIEQFDLVITTYAQAQKIPWLLDYHWNYVILDEAQAIKNPSTKQTRAVKSLQSENRLIMTGTPIENRLGDLWSLFDFINPGLLGDKAEFRKLSQNLRADPEGYGRLRKIIMPYILRRLKTDTSIIADLPDKVELKTYAPLSRKQIVLYQELIESTQEEILASEGITRKGLIFSLLLKFKQICNHPDQYLGRGEYAEDESGKFGRLREICEVIHEKRERLLVFTQFREMTEPLARFLESIFQAPGLVLHGSVPIIQRKRLVETFQARNYVPFMVLSLKAGGVGLNLTAANHVIHFDRWWNPAVENQATDRAFRIGQVKNVLVHKFISNGSIEEKIDSMIEQKSGLARDIISSSGEGWITEMSNEELTKLFSLTL
jgi:non-specific serine/threonine protein kinase